MLVNALFRTVSSQLTVSLLDHLQLSLIICVCVCVHVRVRVRCTYASVRAVYACLFVNMCGGHYC